MADEIKPEVIKKTQKALGKYVKKPQLTEKLLRRPPFRFLHDVISAIIKETGFLNNLFTEEELNPENKDKEAKIAYLTKLINVVTTELSVRPSKIIAGQEPTKTNELLQVIAKALDKNIDSTEVVQHYNNNLKKSTSSKLSTESSKASTTKRSTRSKKETEPSAETETKKSSSRPEHTSRKNKDPDKKEKTPTNKTRQTKRVKTDDGVSAKNAKERSATVKSENKSTTSVKQSSSAPSNNVDLDAAQEVPSEVPSEISVKQSVKSDDSGTSIPSVPSGPVKTIEAPDNREETESASKSKKIEDARTLENPIEKTNTVIARIPEPSAPAKELLRPPSGRPSSARPAAPKLRWKPDIKGKNIEPILAENGNVIVDNFDESHDDNDSMVVLETEGNDYTGVNEAHENINSGNTQEHGYLVAQILETQRELAKVNTVDIIPSAVEAESDSGTKKNPEIISKEVERMQSSIQRLTRATHPMGKLLDFLQEDVELMQKELAEWRSQFRDLHIQLEQEKEQSQATVHPLEASFAGIETKIQEHLEKIYQTKLNIARNKNKIQQLLLGRA